MADQHLTYVKLTRKNRRPGGSSQIWISADSSHLLLVRTKWFVQYYSRFRLRDIQALVVHGQELALPAHAGAIMMTAVLMAFSIQNAASPFSKGFFAILLGSVLMALIVNLARGRRGSVTLITSATRMRLPAITRMKRAEAFVAEVTPLVQAAQADLPILAPEQRAHVAPSATPAPELPEERPPFAILAVLYGSVLCEGMISLVSLYRRLPDAIGNLSWTLAFAGAAMGFYAAVVERKAWSARTFAFLTGLASLIDFGLSAAAAFSMARGKNPPLPPDVPAHLKGLPMWFIEYARVASPILVMLGLAGIAWTVYRASRKESETR